MRLFRALHILHQLLHPQSVLSISNRRAQFAQQRPCGRIPSARTACSVLCEQSMRTAALTAARARQFLSSTSRADCRMRPGVALGVGLMNSRTSTRAFGGGSNRLGSKPKLKNMRKLSGLFCTHTDRVNQEGLENMTVVQLRKLLRGRGLKVSGCKRDLIDRLTSIPASCLEPSSLPSSATTRVKRPQKSLSTRGVQARTTAVTESGSPKSAKCIPRLVREPIDRQPTPRPKPLDVDIPQLRALSWNVNGIRALLGKQEGREALATLVREERPHVLALQETKIQTQHVQEMTDQLAQLLPDYITFWNCSEPPARKGYSGTAVAVRTASDIGCPKFIKVHGGIGQGGVDAEGRVLTVELDSAFVVTVYTPNSGEGLKRLDFRTGTWDQAFAKHISRLERTRPVVVIGDLNVAHEDVDFFNPTDRRTRKAAGTTPEERRSFANYLLGRDPPPSCLDRAPSATNLARHPNIVNPGKRRTGEGGKRGLQLTDTFRVLYPEARGVFSYWSMRAGNRPFNRGMRLDYCLASRALVGGRAGPDGAPAIHDAFVLDEKTVGFSDHCPVGVVFRL